MPTFAKVAYMYRNEWVHGIVDQVDDNRYKVRLVLDTLAAAKEYFCSKRSYDANIAKGAVVPFTDPTFDEAGVFGGLWPTTLLSYHIGKLRMHPHKDDELLVDTALTKSAAGSFKFTVPPPAGIAFTPVDAFIKPVVHDDDDDDNDEVAVPVVAADDDDDNDDVALEATRALLACGTRKDLLGSGIRALIKVAEAVSPIKRSDDIEPALIRVAAHIEGIESEGTISAEDIPEYLLKYLKFPPITLTNGVKSQMQHTLDLSGVLANEAVVKVCTDAAVDALNKIIIRTGHPTHGRGSARAGNFVQFKDEKGQGLLREFRANHDVSAAFFAVRGLGHEQVDKMLKDQVPYTRVRDVMLVLFRIIAKDESYKFSPSLTQEAKKSGNKRGRQTKLCSGWCAVGFALANQLPMPQGFPPLQGGHS